MSHGLDIICWAWHFSWHVSLMDWAGPPSLPCFVHGILGVTSQQTSLLYILVDFAIFLSKKLSAMSHHLCLVFFIPWLSSSNWLLPMWCLCSDCVQWVAFWVLQRHRLRMKSSGKSSGVSQTIFFAIPQLNSLKFSLVATPLNILNELPPVKEASRSNADTTGSWVMGPAK